MKAFFSTCPLILFIAAAVLFSSCDRKEEKGDIELNFVATYDDQPLVWNQSQAYANGQAVKMDRLDLFLSYIRLRKSDGSVEHLSDIELLQFMEVQLDESSSLFGVTLKYKDIEPGAYAAVEIGLGVAPDLNDMTPSDFTSSSPLSRPSYYWEAWDGYIFTKMEGEYAEDGENFDKTFVFHTGTSKQAGAESAYKPVDFESGIEVKAGHTTRVNFILDAKVLFEQGEDAYIDIATKSAAHSLSDVEFMNSIMGNFSRALRIKL